MDGKIKNSCPNCCQLYSLKSLTLEPTSNIPLFIKCGHTMCECCVRNFVKFGEPIECKICLRTMEIKTTDIAKLLQNKTQLYKLFPVNVSVLGELALGLISEKPQIEERKTEDYFLDLQAILDSTDQTQGKCLECHGGTTKMCQQCATAICEDCFNKSHQSFVVFKTHVLQNIEQQIVINNCKVHSQKSLEYYCKDCAKLACMDCLMVASEKSCKSHDVVPILEVNIEQQIVINNCKVHSQKSLVYYCKDCAKSACMDCLMVASEKSCKSHDVVPILEITEKFLSELREVFPQVDATFRRLTKTAVDIGNLLLNMDNDGGSAELRQVTAAIEQHFSKLQAAVLAHREEVMENVSRLRRIERDSLLRAREEVATAIKQSKQVMDALKTALDSDNVQTANLSALLEEAKNIIEKPWCLAKDESEKDSLKVCVSEEVCLLVPDYVQLVGNAQARYALRDTTNMQCVPPPPHAPVFPPILPKGPDIRKAAIQTVMPFAEKKPLIELKAGTQELAHITHIEDPHRLFVRRVRDDPLLAEIEGELCESLGGVPRTVCPGEMYAVKYDGSWKRCRVDAIDNGTKLPTCHVTCVDFGYTTVVVAHELYEIPPSLSAESRYPPLALRCRLANCEPPPGGWSPEHILLLLRMVDRSPVTLRVRRAGASSECDVTTRAGVSVAHALCFHARASLLDPHLPYPETTAAGPRLQPADTALRSQQTAEVFVTHVVSPEQLYVRESYLEADYVKLCEELNNTYDIRDESDLIYLPKEGTVCVALASTGTAHWARAIVLSSNSAEDVLVFLPDTGGQLSVPWDRLRAIRPRFAVLRALAIKSHLVGIKPIWVSWRAEAVELLAQRLGRKLLLVAHQGPSRRRSLGAVLLDPAAAVCVNHELVAKQLATADGTVDFQLLTEKYCPAAKESRSQTPATSDNSTDSSRPMASNYQELQAEAKEIIRLEAKILQYESPSLLYISFVHQQQTFSELFENIQKFYMKRKTTRRDKWKVDDRCCAFCTHSETWRRATILNTEKDKVTVFYTDFAQTETVSISNLKKLHSDFEMIGNAAIKCHLAGILPAGGEWPSLAKEFLKDKLEEYRRVFVTGMGEFVEKSMPVQLWVYHAELGSALEPHSCSWRCLNHELLRRGLALPDTHTTQVPTVESTSDELRFLNVRGSVQEWLLPPLPSSGSSSPRLPVDWLPAEPLRTDQFTGTPTYIDNDAIIYLHDVSQADDLEFIRDTLQMAFKEDDPKAPYCTWRVGEPCVARYYLDSSFYRGTVLEVHPEDANCLVQYVDYGNSELCAFTDLRKRVALHQIPIQAHKVSLSRIKPIGDNWGLDILDYIHKAIVEKKCFVKVTGPPIDGITPVELKYDKLWINDHLVEFQMAVYVDGARPLDRQFKKRAKAASSTPEKTIVNAPETRIDVSNSSEPDYIVEEDIDSSQASGSPDSFKISTLVDRDSPNEDPETLVTYLRHDDREFSCNVPVINDTNSLELSIIRDEETNVIYEALFDVVKTQGKNMALLDGTYEYKPCIALFEGDWYRASILKYSEAKNLLKVRYVDYGNIGIVPLSDAREISKDWVCLPPACVWARLHGLRTNPDLTQDRLTEVFIDTFLDKGPFRATIVDYADYDNSVPLVELRNNDGELVYHNLIEDNVLLRDTPDDPEEIK